MIEENIEMQRLNIKTRCGSNPTFTTKRQRMKVYISCDS